MCIPMKNYYRNRHTVYLLFNKYYTNKLNSVGILQYYAV